MTGGGNVKDVKSYAPNKLSEMTQNFGSCLEKLTMSVVFCGNYATLKKYVGRVDPDGHWRDLEHGGKQYKTASGAVLNWWKKSGKLVFSR
jgi:hypothetical protein